MIHRYRPCAVKAPVIATLGLFLLIAFRCGAQDFFAGARGGISFGTGKQDFYLGEGFAGMQLPWHLKVYSSLYFQPDVAVSAGWLTDGHMDAFMGKIEPILELHLGKFPIAVEVGFSPTYLSRHDFDAKNLGDNVQFTSHIGIDWQITKRFRAGWRMEHMSNGGFAEPNPGVNFQVLSLSYYF